MRLVSICQLIHGANSLVLKMSNFLYSNSLEKYTTALFYDKQDEKNVENHEYFEKLQFFYRSETIMQYKQDIKILKTYSINIMLVQFVDSFREKCVIF
jgi:hypothetical protein